MGHKVMKVFIGQEGWGLMSGVFASATFLAFFFIAACSSSSHSPPDDTGGGVCGGLPVVGPQTPNVSPACVVCANTSCCVERTTCAGVSECGAIVTCMSRCTSTRGVCFDTCRSSHLPGQKEVDAYGTCEFSKCNVECQDFSCLGSVVQPAPVRATYTFKFALQAYTTRRPIVGATIKVCSASDVACATPSATYTTDSTGTATVTAPSAPSGIAGYLEVSGTNLVTTLAYLYGVPFAELTDIALTEVILSPDAFANLLFLAKVEADTTRGHLTIVTVDCSGSSAAGVGIAVSAADANSKTAYVVGGVPTTSATATDGSGVLAVWNVPTGVATVNSTVVASGRKIGVAPVVVRAKSITSLDAVPTP